MDLNEMIEDCYSSGKQLWIVSEDPLSIPMAYGLYGKSYGTMKLLPSDDRASSHRHILDFTLPYWLIRPGSTIVDYSAIPKSRRQEVPSIQYKAGKEYVHFGDIDISIEIRGKKMTLLDMLSAGSAEMKRRTAAVPKAFLDEIDNLYESKSLPDPDDWVEKMHKMLAAPSLRNPDPEGKKRKTFFADPWDKFDNVAIDFILKYWGDPRISKYVSLVVGAPKMPTKLYKEWELFLLQE